MPTYPNLKTFNYYPNPELKIRQLIHGLNIRSILDVGAGHGGVFDHAFWSQQPMERRAACDIHWIRDMGGGWETKLGVNACELTKHYEPKSFDMIQCLEVLEHIPDNRKALEELCKVARKFVVITSADESHHCGPEQEAIEKVNKHQAYVRQPSVRDMEELGFEVRVEHLQRKQLIAWKYI